MVSSGFSVFRVLLVLVDILNDSLQVWRSSRILEVLWCLTIAAAVEEEEEDFILCLDVERCCQLCLVDLSP